jgi:hypothetical protein
MIAAIALLLATSFPSASHTSWMRPDSFHLAVGMSRTDALKKIEDDGWKTRRGKAEDEVTFDYNDSSGVTLQFHKERLTAVRFELFAFKNEAFAAFAEERAHLRTTFGAPATSTKSLLVYNHQLPNVMVVMSAAPQGLWLMVVRYYDPVVKE